MSGWIGVDLDGTLAEYHGWTAPDEIGAPIPRMVDRVKQWLAKGVEVRIVTARVGVIADDPNASLEKVQIAARAIDKWCQQVFGRTLPLTCTKDYHMYELWDDRAVQVVTNTGKTVTEDYDALLAHYRGA